jgi:hypothetical protein
MDADGIVLIGEIGGRGKELGAESEERAGPRPAAA